VSNDQGDIYKIASKDAGFTYLAPHDMVGGGNYEGEPSKAIHPALPVTLEELPAGSNGQSSLAKGDVVDSIQLKPGMKVTDQHANVDTISPNAVMTVQQGPQGLEIVDNKGDHVMDVTGGVYVKIVDAGGSGGPSPEHLAMVGKEVNGSQIVDGMVVKEKWAGPWKVVTKKEAQKTSPDVMYISAKYFLQNPDGSIEKEVVPKFHYTVTDVSGVGGTSLEGKTVKGTQLAPGMKIATDTYPVLTVASTHVSGSPTWYHLLDPDGHIVQNVVPGQNYKVLDTSQVASQAKQTLGEVKIGAHVNVNGKEWLVTGVQGPSSVTLKDPLSDQTQTLHHLTEASVHPEDTLNPNVLESGKLVHQALPASYPLPPKMSQGWIETHVPQMTEKQVSNLIWSLKGKGWNSQEIADRVMPHTQKAKGKAFSSVEQQLGWAIDPNTGHKMFTSHKAGDAWAKSALGGIKKRATSAGAPNADKMWSSLSSYFGSGYSAINGWLRKGKGTDTNVHAKAAAIKEAFKYAAKAPEDFIAFRGTEWPVPLHHGDALIGDYVRDKGFQSASYLRSSATSWGKVAKLVIPEGTPVIWANDSSLSGHPGEKEILFPAGSIYRIIAMEKHGSSGKQQMVLKWVGYDGQFKVPAEKKLYGDDLVNHVRELVKLAEGHYMIVGAD
jgi:hypothetical protein